MVKRRLRHDSEEEELNSQEAEPAGKRRRGVNQPPVVQKRSQPPRRTASPVERRGAAAAVAAAAAAAAGRAESDTEGSMSSSSSDSGDSDDEGSKLEGHASQGMQRPGPTRRGKAGNSRRWIGVEKVPYKRNRYRASIPLVHLRKASKPVELGQFGSERDAARAYDRAQIAVAGRKAAADSLNFPLTDYPGERQRWGPDLHAYLLSLRGEGVEGGPAVGGSGRRGPTPQQLAVFQEMRAKKQRENALVHNTTSQAAEEALKRQRRADPLWCAVTDNCGLCPACRQPWRTDLGGCVRRAVARQAGYREMAVMHYLIADPDTRAAYHEEQQRRAKAAKEKAKAYSRSRAQHGQAKQQGKEQQGKEQQEKEPGQGGSGSGSDGKGGGGGRAEKRRGGRGGNAAAVAATVAAAAAPGEAAAAAAAQQAAEAGEPAGRGFKAPGAPSDVPADAPADGPAGAPSEAAADAAADGKGRDGSGSGQALRARRPSRRHTDEERWARLLTELVPALRPEVLTWLQPPHKQSSKDRCAIEHLWNKAVKPLKRKVGVEEGQFEAALQQEQRPGLPAPTITPSAAAGGAASAGAWAGVAAAAGGTAAAAAAAASALQQQVDKTGQLLIDPVSWLSRAVAPRPKFPPLPEHAELLQLAQLCREAGMDVPVSLEHADDLLEDAEQQRQAIAQVLHRARQRQQQQQRGAGQAAAQDQQQQGQEEQQAGLNGVAGVREAGETGEPQAPALAHDSHGWERSCVLCGGPVHLSASGLKECPVNQLALAMAKPEPECPGCAQNEQPGCRECLGPPAAGEAASTILLQRPWVRRVPWLQQVPPATREVMQAAQGVCNAAVNDLDLPQLAFSATPAALLAVGLLAEEAAKWEVAARFPQQAQQHGQQQAQQQRGKAGRGS